LPPDVKRFSQCEFARNQAAGLNINSENSLQENQNPGCGIAATARMPKFLFHESSRAREDNLYSHLTLRPSPKRR